MVRYFGKTYFFTHRGLSGPAVLQISSYWQPGELVSINLLPDLSLEDVLNEQRNAHPNQSLKNTLAMHLPKRLVECLQQLGHIPDVSLRQLNVRDQQALVDTLTAWQVQPNGTEGYRTAEVTLGRRGYKRTIIADYGSAPRAGSLFYRRSDGRHRLVGRL
ncbi:membrane protein [Salmonella enterica subsp. enterica]|uniref:Membrane protein n=1 Tax=Salmonella enterica I TaxID=59201 RepID=A0A447TT68_SALET|nr:membrane protein [Salmonella enterica subsp. enterica]